MQKKRIIVIGSGFGGLAAAIRLALRGHEVELFEKRDKLGGRAYVYEMNGFKFDGGPTVITVPWLFDELFEAAGKRRGNIDLLWINGENFAAMKRQGPEGEFRSNLHRGGTANLVKLTPAERATAVRAAKIMGLEVCGVDILRSNHGPLVMEVNSSPGLEGIENATKKDVAGMIIEFIEKSAKPNNTKTRGKG